MASTSGTVAIAAAPATILGVIAALDDYPQWADGVSAVKVLSLESSGLPERARFEVNSGFVKGWYIVDYTWSDRAVSWELVESPLLKSLEGEYRLNENGAVTDVTYSLTAVPSMPVLGALRRKAEQQLVDVALRCLAERVAEGAA